MDGRHDALGLHGVVLRQPSLEQRLDFQGQPNQRMARCGSPRSSGALDDSLDFMVVYERDDGRHHDAHRHAPLMQARHRPQARRWAGGARLEPYLERVRQGGDAEHDGDEIVAGQFLQHIKVAQHQGVLGDDAHRMAALGGDLQNGAGDAQPLLDRLVGVGVGAHGNGAAAVGPGAELLDEPLPHVGLVEDLGFKIEPRREVQIGVRGPGEAIHAAVLAALVGVDGAVEGHIRGGVAGDQAHGAVREELGGGRGLRLLPQVPAIVHRHRGGVQIAAPWIQGGAAALVRHRPGPRILAIPHGHDASPIEAILYLKTVSASTLNVDRHSEPMRQCVAGQDHRYASDLWATLTTVTTRGSFPIS